MRITVLALSLTTVAFAASTWYLARELREERARTVMQSPMPAPAAAAAAAPPIPASAIKQAVQQSPPAERTSSAVATSTPADASQFPPALDAASLAQQHENDRQLVARFDDPEQRAEMVAEYKAMMRNSSPRLAEVLGLSKEDFGRLIDLLALEQVENQVRFSRCNLDSPCDVSKIAQYGSDSATQDIANMLGPEGQQKYFQYRDSAGEREAVTQFRTRLSDVTHLGDDTAEALIAVLADERSRISSEASRHGAGLTGIGNGLGMVWISETSESPEARYESATENSRRLRARAAEVLTPAQMRAFDEMQDELLLSTRHQLRQKSQFRAVTITN